jgi:hypothetical protein
MKAMYPPKRLFSQDLQGATSQRTELFHLAEELNYILLKQEAVNSPVSGDLIPNKD